MCNICAANRPFDPTCVYSSLPTASATSSTQGLVSVAQAAPTGTLDDLAAYLTGGFWLAHGGSQHSFDTSTSNVISVNLTSIDSRGQMLAREALQAWEAVADVKFVEVSGSADITFSNDQPGAYSSYLAYGSTTDTANVNVSLNWINTYGTGYDDYTLGTFIHEIGHALGLGHQGNYDGAATYGLDETFANDSYQLSIMSYFSQYDNTTVDASYALPMTPMAADILAVQNLYGAPGASSQTAGDTVYGVNQTVGGYFGDFFDIQTTGNDPANRYNGSPVTFTIYDLSGIDTVDFSNDTTNQVVDLQSLGIWDVYGLTGNVVVARDTVLENYTAGSGNDSITGNAADNILQGNRGRDTLEGGAGADVLNGGSGRDQAVYWNAATGVTVDLVTASANTGEAAGDTFVSIENLGGSNGGDDLRGDAAANALDGRGGNDMLQGRGANDTIRGRSGHDTLMGQSGDDWLLGGGGDDTLDGGSGNNWLFGQDGNDHFIGGVGADKFFGGAGIDTADYSNASAGLIADMLSFSSGTGDAAGDKFRDVENLTGSAFDDQLWGTNGANELNGSGGDDLVRGRSGNDTIIGGDGNDKLYGQDGNDSFIGGLGADTMSGGTGIDTVDFSNSASGLIVDMAHGNAGSGDAAGDQMLSIEKLIGSHFNDDLRGTGVANDINGSAGNDFIRGRGGDDTINGGDGNDRLLGQGGADTFVFTSGFDKVLDFQDNVDTLQIDAALVAPGTTAQDLITNFADDSSGQTVINFGDGNILKVSTISNAQDLVDDIVII